MAKINRDQLQLAENVIRAIVTASPDGVKVLAVALHNAFAHGEVFKGPEQPVVSDEQLEALYVSLDAFEVAAKDIVKSIE